MRGGSVTLSRCGLVAAGIWASLTRTVDAQTPVQLVELRTEYQASPLGLDVRAPRLSWKIESSRRGTVQTRSEEHTSELQSRSDLVCRLLLEKKKKLPNNSKHAWLERHT